MYIVGFCIMLHSFFIIAIFQSLCCSFLHFLCQQGMGEGGKRISKSFCLTPLLTARINKGQRTKDLSQTPKVKLHCWMTVPINITSCKTVASSKYLEKF